MEEWSKNDTKFLRKFFDSETGQKVKEKVRSHEPKMDAKNFEEMALLAAAHSQYRKDVDLIRMLLEEQVETKEKSPFLDLSGLDVNET